MYACPLTQLVPPFPSHPQEFDYQGATRAPITNQSEFEACFESDSPMFEAEDSTGKKVALCAGGRSMPVTFANRLKYVKMYTDFRLREFDAHVAALRRGLASVVPMAALVLYTWQELEVLVAGRPQIDIETLRMMTSYSGYQKDDPVMKRFWKVFASMSDEERSKYVRFTWGRSRLPSGTNWSNRHTLQRAHGATADARLPVAHTCFFSIELPPYSTEERMRWGLLTAIHYGGGGILNA